MKNRDIFESLFYLDETSPTGLRRKKDDEPAGEKQRSNIGNGYLWVVMGHTYDHTGRKRRFLWTLPNCLYELHNGREVQRNEMISYLDDNKDNLSPDNLVLVPFSIDTKVNLKAVAWDHYRNVILPKASEDYYKDPSEWTTPEALEALSRERLKRENGESVRIERTRPAGRKESTWI